MWIARWVEERMRMHGWLTVTHKVFTTAYALLYITGTECSQKKLEEPTVAAQCNVMRSTVATTQQKDALFIYSIEGLLSKHSPSCSDRKLFQSMMASRSPSQPEARSPLAVQEAWYHSCCGWSLSIQHPQSDPLYCMPFICHQRTFLLQNAFTPSGYESHAYGGQFSEQQLKAALLLASHMQYGKATDN